MLEVGDDAIIEQVGFHRVLDRIGRGIEPDNLELGVLHDVLDDGLVAHQQLLAAGLGDGFWRIVRVELGHLQVALQDRSVDAVRAADIHDANPVPGANISVCVDDLLKDWLSRLWNDVIQPLKCRIVSPRVSFIVDIT